MRNINRKYFEEAVRGLSEHSESLRDITINVCFLIEIFHDPWVLGQRGQLIVLTLAPCQYICLHALCFTDVIFF